MTAELLSQLLSRVDGRAPHTVVTLPAPLGHPAALLDLGEDAFAWLPPEGPRFAAFGATAKIEASGPERFASVKEQAAKLFAGVAEVNAGAAPPARLFGGFAFHPGSASEGAWATFGDASFVLPRWRYTVDAAGGAWLSFAFAGPPPATAREELGRVLAALAASRPKRSVTPASAPTPLARTSLEVWTRAVLEIVSAIREGRVAKVVAARRTGASLATPPLLGDVMRHLGDEDRKCTAFAFARQGAAFVGITPERLVEKAGRRFHTEALAGSAIGLAWIEGPPTKELAEHQFVVDAILDTLRPLADAIDHAPRPEYRQLRRLAHLVTPIEGTLHRDVHVLDLVARLHPTPAVAGVPRAAAVSWILEHELDPRGWYSGPIGWFDGAGDGDFLVALRSALLAGNAAYAYAGSGIVLGSDPLAEYQETETKQHAILGALGALPPELA